ncbi:adenylyl cyclase-associated protein 2-like [Salvia splendens]|uniref:adenylyl cyclase-associated protein 2-like n=1 Tax=Salvia splendens TaxID=180675 RepID=UPI001C25DCAA|nr:adenylyl cyclase-associated protein 2-like [Salvia splendens]
MSDEGPKLFTNKPKKSQLKASGMTSSSSAGATAPPPPPPPPPTPPVKETFQRFKFYKTIALVLSLTVGAYAFARTVLKVGPQEKKAEDPTISTSSSSTSATATTITEQPASSPGVEPIQRPPIPEEQQRELYKWMLEEKRKAKPRDAEEKKRIDEEKGILKQLIRAKSLPKI